METKKKKMRMNVALLLMATILADPCSAYLSPDIGILFVFSNLLLKSNLFLLHFLLIAEIHALSSVIVN
jgi:hypothetical protein